MPGRRPYQSLPVHGELGVDTAAHTVTRSGAPVDQTSREFAQLLLLLESRGRVLSRQQLEARLYNRQDAARSNAVESMSITCAASSATVWSRPCAASGLSVSGGHSREIV